MAPLIFTPNTVHLRIKRDGERIYLINNGRILLNMPYDAALQVAEAIRAQAKQAEEQAKADQIISDQALLMRTGAPVGLTDHPYLLKEAGKEAAWNSDLRRYLPGGVKSKEAVGKPSIKQHHPPKRGE